MIKEKVLFVDDEVNVLHALRRQLYKSFTLDLANSVDEAFEYMDLNGPYAVIVSDMRMPDMIGTDFLREAAVRAPQSVRIMLTGNADQETAAEAINKGGVFQFLTKPCSSEDMQEALIAAIKKYHINVAEQRLLKQTLVSTIRLMSNVLAIVDPIVFGHVIEVQRGVSGLASMLKVKNIWQLEAAAMLSQVLFVTVPEDIRLKYVQGHTLNPEEINLMRSAPVELSCLIREIPQLELVADIVYYCFKNADGTGYPEDDTSPGAIPGGAKIIRAISDLQLLQRHSDKSAADILLAMRKRSDIYDRDVISHLRTLVILEDQQFSEAPVKVAAKDLQPGDFLVSDLRLVNDKLLLFGGQRITEDQITLLASNINSHGVAEPIFIVRAQTG